MNSEISLSPEQAATARQIQSHIDALARDGGGRVVLPAMDLTLDRGLTLRSGVELTGQGDRTVLRKGPGQIYPLSGYHNYGMCDVPLADATGLEVGMTVSVHDGNAHGGFYETFATITWIQDNWVGLDHGIEADYRAEDKPALTTVYPLVFGHRIKSAAVRDLRLEGNRAASDRNMGGCRGGAIYFYQSRDLEITGIRETDYDGEGLSFQMCRDVVIRDCRFDGNSGNGLHPGAGSTNVLFESCGGRDNAKSGFFFCVRANHITVRDCDFEHNDSGMSIGTRDCHNLIEDCRIRNNRRVGLLVRPSPRPVEVHSCHVCRCHISANGGAQVDITSDAHDLLFAGNRIDGEGKGIGIRVAGTATSIGLVDNRISQCEQDVQIEDEVSIGAPPQVSTCGYADAPSSAFRHLSVPELSPT
jgi:hypothetical protein